VPATDRPRSSLLPLAAGWLAAGVGIMNLVSALTTELPRRLGALAGLAPHELVLTAHALALPAGVGLVVIARHLALRRRRALHLAFGLLVAAGALNLLKGLDIEEATASWALAALLWWSRDAFCVRHDPGGLPVALRQVATLVAAATITTVGAVALATHGARGPGGTLFEALHSLVLGGWGYPMRDGYGWLPLGAGLLGAVTLMACAAALFRPLAAEGRRHAGDARRLVRAHGADTLSFFKLRGDLHHLFTADRRAFASYRIERGVLLVSGDPVGDPGALPALARDLRAFADVRGLRLGVVGAGESSQRLFATVGLRSLYLGDEAIVETEGFTLEGRRMKKVRQATHRLGRHGYGCEWRRLGDLSPGELATLERVSARWRGKAPERGFSMAMDTLRGEHLDETVVVLARDPEGAVRGFLHLVPSYGRPALSLSAMRRDPDTPNGLIDVLVVRAVELARERGIQELSLNFAAFARLMHDPSGPRDRLLGRIVALGNPLFQIESLYRFNAKFHPRWEPRHLLHEGPLDLPRTALAALQAEGQMPRLGTLRQRPATAVG
jgi:lysyl-tRNA synthetase class 2